MQPSDFGLTEAQVKEMPDESVEPSSRREDVSNARRFADQHCERVRFWHGRNKWVLWRDYWKEDEVMEVSELAKETARRIFAEASTLPSEEAIAMGKWAEKSMSRDKLHAMLDLAKSDPRIRAATEQFDALPYLINFTSGTFDIETAQLRQHSREDFITKMVHYPYAPSAIADTWRQFIAQTFGELSDWIQTAVGYSLTGDVSEKVAFLLVGRTNTGKSTFLSTLRTIFADYCSTLRVETLMWNRVQDNNAAADLADLRGARFVTTSETEEGQRLREAQLKSITQGIGEIKTARKYENPIRFRETHKLWIDANHAPIIRGTDDAIWNRLLPIPCKHQVTEGQDLDRDLPKKLLAEAPGIIAWAVNGAVRWKAEGLPRPNIILDARNEWRERMDLIGQFLEEECEPGEWGEVTEAYRVFVEYAKSHGEQHPIVSTAFGLRLAERGMPSKLHHSTRRRMYLGLKLRGPFARNG